MVFRVRNGLETVWAMAMSQVALIHRHSWLVVQQQIIVDTHESSGKTSHNLSH